MAGTVALPENSELIIREADQMKISQHFSAGDQSRFGNESAKRTTELSVSRVSIFQPSATPFPAINLIFTPSAARTTNRLLLSEGTLNLLFQHYGLRAQRQRMPAGISLDQLAAETNVRSLNNKFLRRRPLNSHNGIERSRYIESRRR
jgi:hypothetical protein